MQLRPTQSHSTKSPVISVVHDAMEYSLSAVGHIAMLRRLAARLVFLADTARAQAKFELEKTMTRTAAEVLTSSKEIASSDYADKFIQRLIKSIRKIETTLGAASASLHTEPVTAAH